MVNGALASTRKSPARLRAGARHRPRLLRAHAQNLRMAAAPDSTFGQTKTARFCRAVFSVQNFYLLAIAETARPPSGTARLGIVRGRSRRLLGRGWRRLRLVVT